MVKMKYPSIYYLLLVVILFFSCESALEEELINNERETSKKEIMSVFQPNFEAFVRRKVEAELGISAVEKYDLQIHLAHLDKDTITDAVILINRKQFALDKAQKESKEKFLENTGYTARENYVYVFKGGSGKILSTPPVGSSIFHPLTVEFEEISTPGQNDFWVAYRLRNSLFRNYYTMRGEKLFLTLNCPVFDEIGNKEPEAYYIEHRSVATRIAKDIVIYKGKIKDYDPSTIVDINNFTPSEIIPTDYIDVYFIFDPDRKTYVTPMAPKDQSEE
jgi:hypothetical protein